MKQPEFTVQQQFILDSHDFYLYDDPVVQSLRQWEISGDQWNSQIKFLHGAIHFDDFAQAEAELVDIQNRYADNFSHAAQAIAADSPIQEMAVRTLDQLIRDEDARRRERIGSWYTKSDMPEPTAGYIDDLAMAFGDPDGVILPPDSPYVTFDHNTAREYFASRISGQADHILDTRRRSFERYNNLHTKRSLGGIASRFIKRFGGR